MKLRNLQQKLRKFGFYYLKKKGERKPYSLAFSFSKKTIILSRKNNLNLKPYQFLILKKIDIK